MTLAKFHLNNACKDLRNENLSRFKLDYTRADFSGADLRGADLSGLTLREANFTRAKLAGVTFKGANLQGADFTRASVDIKPSVDADSSLARVNFSNTNIQGAIFTKAVLCHADFTQAHAGLDHYWRWIVVFVSLATCILSGFTSAIATTFTLHYFFLAPRQTLPLPDQKPSLPISVLIGLWSVILVASIRTILNNRLTPSAVVWHVGIAIALILIALLFAALVMDEAKANVNSLIWIALVVLSPLILLLATEAFTKTETWLGTHLPFLADPVVKGLGGREAVGKSSSWIFAAERVVKEPTNGKWVSGIYGAGIGAFFGCWFSRLAIAGDERFAWLWRIYVKFTAIKSTTFNQADLTGTIFTLATLQGASFKDARTAKIRWHNAKCLDCARIGDSYLKYPKIRQLVVTKEWEGQDQDFDGLELEGINLEEASLHRASFIGTNLSQANLRGADLTDADIKKASLEGADLTNADLTGACIQAWTIDEATILSGVNCEYVFLKDAPDPRTGIRERLPDAAAETGFEPGDFETLFKKDSATIQLFIRNSDNRQALSTAFQQLIKDTHFVFQGFEAVGGNALVKIRVSQRTNKSAASNKFYQTLRQAQESQKDSELKEYREQPLFEFILNLVKEIMSGTPKFYFSDANIGNVADSVVGGQNSVQHIYAPKQQRQTLTEAAAEIQRLLKQLEQTNPTATEAEKVAYVNDRTTPSLRNRVVGALQAGGEAAIEQFLDNPYVNVGKAVVKGWIKPE